VLTISGEVARRDSLSHLVYGYMIAITPVTGADIGIKTLTRLTYSFVYLIIIFRGQAVSVNIETDITIHFPITTLTLFRELAMFGTMMYQDTIRHLPGGQKENQNVLT
jgi:hypothetical protein